MTEIHKYQLSHKHRLSRVNHELHGVKRGHLRIRHLKREIQLNRRTRLNHTIQSNREIQSNRKTRLNHMIRLNHVKQKSVGLFVNHKIRAIRSIHSRRLIRKSQPVQQNCHTIRRNRWSEDDQLQTNHQNRSSQPKHPNQANEQIS